MFTNLPKLLLGGLGALGLTMQQAPAALVCTPSGTDPGTCTEIVTGTNVASLTLDKFVSFNGHVLTKVEYVLNQSFEVQIQLRSPTGAQVIATTTTHFDFKPAPNAPSNFLVPPVSVDSAPLVSTFNIAAGATFPFDVTLVMAEVVRTLTTDLGGFVGPGLFAALINPSTSVNLNVSGGLAFSGLVSTVVSSIQLTYFYDQAPAAIPEPGSLALLGVGLLGLAMFARHRSAIR